MFTTIDISETGNYADNTQKDFESVMQVISLRGTPVIIGEPSIGPLNTNGSPSLSGNGWIVRFAFEQSGVHTVETLIAELDTIVLNGGVIDTTTVTNTEFIRTTEL